MLGTNLLLTYWILNQAYHLSALEAWLISNPSGAGNLMAAQINMTIPLVLSKFEDARGSAKIPYLVLVPLNCLAVFLVMSRNGIGSLAIVLTLYILFNRKRLALLGVTSILGLSYFMDSILQMPFIYQMLVKMRLVGFKAAAPRSLIWDVSWDHVVQNPLLGVGPGNPQRFLSVMDINHAHNNFIQVALESGLLAAAIFTAMMLLLLWMPASTILRKREHFIHTLPLIAYIVFSWTGGPLAFPGATLLLAACVNEARVAIMHDRNAVSHPAQSMSAPRTKTPVPSRAVAARAA
jgi:O-antigen ligase